ncbi:unnamed protein product [Cuscuta europaea]|uniref:RNase H type-1 domain-containing protein n=1 Tax=Cuscuta europaea TaxID=41803 RepID=A0A9P0ZXD5_CUSEU|nr:unnamed protein product [Cuscuta europaea]
MVAHRGIEPNPEKVKAILDMELPRNAKEVQILTGRLAALGRFLSRSADKSLPFFQVLKKSNGFQWTQECQVAFKELKKYLQSDMLLSKPEAGETLVLYLGVTQSAVNSILVREEGTVQRSVYYVSKVLHGAELRYPALEKTALAIYVTTKKLAHYFQAHPIKVLSDLGVGTLFRTAKTARVVKWSLLISQYQVSFQPRTASKGQALVDFLVECIARDVAEERCHEEDLWTLMTDGSSSGSKGCGGGVVLITPEGFKTHHALRYSFNLSNNEVEYEALLSGLRIARYFKVQKPRIKSDSKLVIKQLRGEYEAKEARIQKNKDTALGIIKQFEECDLL